jgi:hypothetical protein
MINTDTPMKNENLSIDPYPQHSWIMPRGLQAPAQQPISSEWRTSPFNIESAYVCFRYSDGGTANYRKRINNFSNMRLL